MRALGYAIFLVVCVSALLAQGPASSSYHKARVFITDSQSWAVGGGGGGSGAGFGEAASGGARPQTAEIVKTFGERCPEVIVNNMREKADYVVLLDHEGGKSSISRDNKVAVFNKDGDSIVSHSTRTLGNAVKEACEAVTKDWSANSSKYLAVQPVSARVSEGMPGAAGSRISISSTPERADIEMDGSFVGNTPSVIDAAPGDHTISIKKPGYKTWERKVKAVGGSVNISAELEKAE